LKAWPILGVTVVQALVLLAHWFLYRTVIAFWPSLSEPGSIGLGAALALLGGSFIVAALLSFRYSNWLVALIYKVAAVWLGLLNFIFFAAMLTWLTDFALRLTLSDAQRLAARPTVATVYLCLAVLVGIYGILNARWIRVRDVTVKLGGLPPSWRGRKAVLVSDLHLGNVVGHRFCRQIVERTKRLNPDIVFVAGDLFDGSEADPNKLATPLFTLSPPLGIFVSTGNHEEFGGLAHYVEFLERGGIRVLNNERVIVDGLHIAGVPYGDSTYPMRLRAFLEGLHLGANEASILLNHVPNRLPIVEQAGVSLQLSGHTHGGQIFPFSWITHRAFGKFTYGLQRFGALQVYTSSGAGTWGPPMRVGTHPEIVLLRFE
jgi:predicted MPP superfamily phosphohydrolase